MRWYLLTGEYPPSLGGVADYTQQVANGLAGRGEEVTVCAPAGSGRKGRRERRGTVWIEWLPGHFGPCGVQRLRTFLAAAPPGGRLLLQYVPHAFGWKAMNVLLCAWLASQRRHRLWVMFHEVAYPLASDQPWRHKLLARVNCWMARQLAAKAERILVSTPAWIPVLETICVRSIRGDWIPIPSNFEVSTSDDVPWRVSVEEAACPTIGHFGTFSHWIMEQMAVLIPAILSRCPQVRFGLLGRGSKAFADRMRSAHPALRERIVGFGEMSRAEVVAVLQSCDVLVQPYADGINARRTSAMAALALNRPIVTRMGPNSEPLWRESGGVFLVDSDDPECWAAAVYQLMDSAINRQELGARGDKLYWSRFSLGKTLDRLLGTTAEPSADGV